MKTPTALTLLNLLHLAEEHFTLMASCDPEADMWATVYLGYVEAMRKSVLLGGNFEATHTIWLLLLDAEGSILEDTEWAPRLNALLCD